MGLKQHNWKAIMKGELLGNFYLCHNGGGNHLKILVLIQYWGCCHQDDWLQPKLDILDPYRMKYKPKYAQISI